jgi:hypothetical protein
MGASLRCLATCNETHPPDACCQLPLGPAVQHVPPGTV